MDKINSRAKGAAGERELAAALREMGIADARRRQQFSGGEGRDDVVLPGVHTECKVGEKIRWWEALAQARRDSGQGLFCLFVRRKSRRHRGEPWLICLELRHLPDFIEKWQAAVDSRS